MKIKYLIGSHLLGLQNNHDTDYLVIINDEDDIYSRRCVDGEDIVYCTKTNIDNRMNFRYTIDDRTASYYIINYQLDKDIIGQEFPLSYSILDRRNDYVKLLNFIVDNKACNFTREVDFNNGHTAKNIYHIAYLVFILENNSTKLTEEQKVIVQKIHDKQMPREYLDELEAKIRKL